MLLPIYGIIWFSLAVVMYSEQLEQKLLKENKKDFSYSLFLEKVGQKTIQLTLFSVVLPLAIHSIFGLGQSLALTNCVVNRERNTTFFVKSLFIKSFPKVENSLLFETLLQTSPQEVLEKMFELFYNENLDFEKEKVKDFFIVCCKVEQESGNLLPKLNVPPIPSFFFPQQTFLHMFQKNLLHGYEEKIEKIKYIYKVLQTFEFIKPYLKEIHSNPVRKVLSFFKKTPISIAFSPKKFVFSYITGEKKVNQFP